MLLFSLEKITSLLVLSIALKIIAFSVCIFQHLYSTTFNDILIELFFLFSGLQNGRFANVLHQSDAEQYEQAESRQRIC